jgi:capsular polysaccharide biosynthesis protein
MEELDIRQIIEMVQKRIWIIIVFTVLAAVLAGIISGFFLDEIYSSYTTLIVSKQNEGASINDLQLSDVNLARNLVNTYSVIIKSNLVLEKVIQEVNPGMGLAALKSNISVNSENNTEIIRITVEDTIPERARDLANSLAVVFIQEVQSLLKMENVQVIDMAKANEIPIKPRTGMNIAVAAVLGMMLGFALVFLLEYLDNTIKTPEDLERYLDLPVIGIIPDFEE